MVLVPLTFSPGRPLSPTVPGSVRPGRPYIMHSDVSSELSPLTLNSLAVMTVSFDFSLRKKLAKKDKQETPDMCCYSNGSRDTPSLLWVQAVQLQPVRVHINGWNNSNYLCSNKMESTSWNDRKYKALKALVFRNQISPAIADSSCDSTVK